MSGGDGGEVEDDDVSSFSSWSYRGEGSHNLVIAHNKERMVYRLLKRKTFSNHSFYVNKQQSDAELRSRLEKSNNFLEHVIRPLLGPHFTPPVPQIVEVPLSLLEEMKGAIRYKYPGCEQDCPLALQMFDNCFLPNSPGTNIPTFCFELRPNLLLMAKGDAVEQQSPIKKLVCRHCFTHAAKVKTGVWSDMCKSCPMELVSGDPTRTKAALMKLLASPHNRLKIFKDGEVIFSQKSNNPQELVKVLQPYFGCSTAAHNGPAAHRTMDSVFELVTKCLLHSPPDTLQGNGVEDCNESGSQLPPLSPCTAPPSTCEETTCIVSQATRQGEPCSSSLPKGCVLECIRNMQYLGQLDIEGIQQYYKRLQQNQINVMDDYHDADWSNIVGGKTCGQDDGSIQYACQKVKEFLIYLTMKSASIMVTLRPHFQPVSQGIGASHVHRANSANSNGAPHGHQGNSSNSIGAPHVHHANGSNSVGAPYGHHANGGNSVICDDEGRSFHFNVTVVDLDPKPVQKIPTSLRQNNKYIDIFMKEYCSDSNLLDFQRIQQNH